MSQRGTGRGGRDPNATLQEASAHYRAGRHQDAIDTVSPLLGRAPTTEARARANHLAGMASMFLGEHRDADGYLSVAAKLLPSDTSIAIAAANAACNAGQPARSLALIESVVGRHPTMPEAVEQLATTLQMLGRHEEAAERVEASGVDHPLVDTAFAASALRVGRTAEAIDRLKRREDDPTVQGGVRTKVLDALARLFDAEGAYDEAFDRAAAMNAQNRRPFDAEGAVAEVLRLREVWTAETLAAAPRGADRSRLPVFVIGMPRSGTTLVERSLAGRPGVVGAGELTLTLGSIMALLGSGVSPTQAGLRSLDPKRVTLAGYAHLRSLKKIGGRADRVIDKHPYNFLHLGHLALTLPGSSIVHVRRDPRDTCLSCFFRSFITAMPVTSDLRTLGMFYTAYAALMEHWARVFGEIDDAPPLVQVEYETLVREHGSETARMLEGIGLDAGAVDEYTDAGAAPTLTPDQAGRGVDDRSIGRWKNYEHRLGPLLEALAPVL